MFGNEFETNLNQLQLIMSQGQEGRNLKKGDRKKLEIIEAAIECLAEEGIENTTFEAIAKRIETRRAHVAYHFKDKNMIFEAAINYILVTYAQTLQEFVQKAEQKITKGTPQNLIEEYIKGAFYWSKKNPEHVSVFLLFYYLTTFQKSYRDLNTKIRLDGQERIHYLLNMKMELDKSKAELKEISSIIQNILSAKMVELFTTNYNSTKKAQDETIAVVRRLLK